MKIRKTSIAIIALIICVGLLSTAFAYLWVTRTIDYSLSVKTTGNFAIYQDADCTIPITTRNYGEIDVSTAPAIISFTNYFKNTGNTPITVTYTMSIPDGWALNTPQTGYSRTNVASELTAQLFFYYTGGEAENGRWLPVESTATETATAQHTFTIPYKGVLPMTYKLVVGQGILAEAMNWQLSFDGESV